MRIVIVIFLVLLLAPSGNAGHVRKHGDGRIVPGERIGPARLGMSEVEIDAVNGETDCPVEATYSLSGVVVRLVTEWGGGCQVSGDVQVGMSFAPAAAVLGRPDKVSEDARYPGVTAYWMTYGGWGIAFRVLVIGERSTIIQAIAIFSGTAVVAPKSRLLQAEPWK